MTHFTAIHIVTESTDHYNYLIEYENISDVITRLEKLGSELGCVCNTWVTTQVPEHRAEIENLLWDKIRVQNELNHQEWLVSLGED